MPKRKKGSRDLTFIREYLEEFLSGIVRGSDAMSADLPVLWIRRERYLRLSHDEAIRFRRLLRDAQRKLTPLDDLSEKALDSALKDAIFAVVDTTAPEEAEHEGRLDAAIADLRSFLEAEPQSYECWIEITGPEIHSLPAGFGRTTFCVVGPLHIDLLRDIVRTKHQVQVSEKLENLDERESAQLLGRVIAIQCVEARDAGAARSLAERDVQQTLDCLNFVGELIPYNRGHLRMAPGRTAGGSGAQVSIAKDGSYTTDSAARHPWTYSFDKLREVAGPGADVIRRIDELLAQHAPNEVENSLIRAVRWAGRAAESESFEDKFLFSVVALESLLLSGSDRELSFRLSLLVARTLGRDAVSRQKISRDVRRLYGLRSKLVHDGRFEVTEDDQDLAMTIAIETIAQLLTDENVQTFTTGQQLQEHFNRLILE
ncbi:MAG: hypothetical protein F4Y29_04045 [Chloroflexi bacterium]|nr:hypothetical protein [Chloroflexota bacterium]MYF80235.1 hypothetical protein [Chloroflexota bacterium]